MLLGGVVCVVVGGILVVLFVYGSLMMAMPKMRSCEVVSLHIYPIKSCAGLTIDQAAMTRLGFEWDRRFVVVDSKTNLMISQRSHPQMALIRPTVSQDHNTGKITLKTTFPGKTDFQEVFCLEDAEKKLPTAVVEVWRQKIVAARLSHDASKWFSDIIGKPCYLATIKGVDAHDRPVKAHAVNSGDQAGAFADGYTYLLASEESLASVNAKLRMKGENAVSMDRFRPNIVVKGVGEGFAEDGWARITIGGIEFQCVRPCSRCALPTVEQNTGVRNKNNEPTRTMKTFRFFPWVIPNTPKIYFGQNMICTEWKGKKPKTIKIGDRVKVKCPASSAGRQTSALTRMMVFASKLLRL